MPILVVDDNEKACQVLSAILSAATQGSIKTCQSPAAAYRVLEFWQPEIIITDYRMSPVDGLEFTRELRSNEALGCALKPILLVTGENPNSKLVKEVRAAGADTMITKPIVARTLIGRLEWAAEQAQLRSRQVVPTDSILKTAEPAGEIWMLD